MRKRLENVSRSRRYIVAVVVAIFLCVTWVAVRPPSTDAGTHATLSRGDRSENVKSSEELVITLEPSTATAESFDVALEQCVASRTDVLLVGNRPVGTYLCSYFPGAPLTPGGCKLKCPIASAASPRVSPFTCTILNMGTPEQLRSADIVVNHHGPVPKKYSPLEPVLTVFYSGESNASEGKKSLHSYQTKYDTAVSFHTHRPLYFTWTNRFHEEFSKIERKEYKWPEWSKQRNAVAIFVSRCKKGGREAVMQALGKHYPVHSFGKCHRTHLVEQEFPQCANLVGRYPQKLCVFRHYKYILALDNSREMDYVTEKVYHALLAGAVPIYDGAPNGEDYLPGGWKSVVRLSDFQANASGVVDYVGLAAKLRELQEPSSAELQSVIEWRHVHSELEWGDRFVDHLHHDEPTCQLCDAARRKKCASLR